MKTPFTIKNIAYLYFRNLEGNIPKIVLLIPRITPENISQTADITR